MDPVTPIETLCRIILRAREYEAQVPTDYDGGEAPENIDGEDGDTLSVLDDEMNSGVEEELTAAFDDLAEGFRFQIAVGAAGIALSMFGLTGVGAGDGDRARDDVAQGALRPLDLDVLAVERHLHSGGDGDGQSADA